MKVGPLEFEVQLTVDVGGKKLPKVNSIGEAANRVAEKTDEDELDIGQWLDEDDELNEDSLSRKILVQVNEDYAAKNQEWDDHGIDMRQVEKQIMLQILDQRRKEHARSGEAHPAEGGGRHDRHEARAHPDQMRRLEDQDGPGRDRDRCGHDQDQGDGDA